MRSRIVGLLPVGLMLLLAILTLWLRQAIETPGTRESRPGRNDPDAIVDSLRITRLDENGAAQYLLTAKRMVHYSGDDSTELEMPRFTRQADGTSLVVTASRGRITRDNDEAFFYGNVELVRAAGRDSPEMRLETEFLHILSSQDVLRSDRLVTLREGARVLSGVGMEYNRRSRQFELQSRVKGSFDVAKNR